MGKKDFSKANATLDNFISQESREKIDGKPKGPRPKPTPKKKAPEETRSRRVQLVITPSLYEKIYNAAWREHLTVNEAINRAIEEYTKRSK